MISTSRIVHVFESLVSQLEVETGGPVHLIRIMGPRSSFVAGKVPASMPFVASVRVMLGKQWALLLYPAAGKVVDHEKIQKLFQASTV